MRRITGEIIVDVAEAVARTIHSIRPIVPIKIAIDATHHQLKSQIRAELRLRIVEPTLISKCSLRISISVGGSKMVGRDTLTGKTDTIRRVASLCFPLQAWSDWPIRQTALMSSLMSKLRCLSYLDRYLLSRHLR